LIEGDEVMKRRLIALIACVMMLFNFAFVGSVQAQPLAAFSLPGLKSIGLSEQQQELINQLGTQYLPQIENILSPAQREQFEAAIEGGKSLRKAFKSMTLDPEQKTQLVSVFKAFPAQEVLATLTPEQKKELFMKKKEMFMPTADEITEKISAGMKKKEMFSPTAETELSSEELEEKISAAMERKKAFMPSLEEIKEKIAEKMATITEEE
jgi:hypothetical protein